MRINAILFVFAVLSATIAKAEEKNTVYQSPDEVYTAAQKAFGANDRIALSNCFTEESIQAWAFLVAREALAITEKLERGRLQSDQVTPESIKKILKKHGFDKGKYSAESLRIASLPKDHPDKTPLTIVKNIKHKPMFVGEVYEELGKIEGKHQVLDPLKLLKWVKEDFLNLQVEEKTATATVPFFKDGKKLKDLEVEFQVHDGGWLIHFPIPPKKKESSKSTNLER